MKSHLTHNQHMNQSSSNFGFSAEDPAAVSPISLIDHPVEVVAKSVVSPDPEPIVDSGPAFSPVGEVCNPV